MKSRMSVLPVTTAALALLFSATTLASPPANSLGASHGKHGDDLSHPLGKKQRELRSNALQEKIAGNAYGKVHEVARGQYVELERTGEDSIFTILVEYSNFSHNSIAEPDRAVDNTTNWVEDFSREHFMEMLFSEAPDAISMRNFYIEQSSNRYTVNGDVTEWVPAPGTAESYDDDNGAFALWQLHIDAANGWYQSKIDAGLSPQDINDYLSQFDVWDRYDYDGDGDFNEPDGYIDHFQIVHAGEGEEAGGGALGGAAIWSHRWYAFFNTIGSDGPAFNLAGGVQIGESDYWIGDYTIEPENGGVGVFAHEFGHDLDLPDLYNTGGGPENSTGFWTLMSSGSWLSQDADTIGTAPGHMGMWEKFQLGWMNYEVAFAGSKSEHKLGPAETNTKQAQGLFVVLPQKEVTTQIADPYEGDFFYYSGQGNNLENTMGKAFTLAAGSQLTAMVNFDIETDWDYAYLLITTDGENWAPVETNLSTNSNPNGNNFGNGITGFVPDWTPLVADLSAYTGDVGLAFLYWTDGAVVNPGFMVDNIEVTGYPVDGAESDTGWEFDGFRVTTGTETAFYNNYYAAEFRQYRGADVGLDTGPYNFGFLDDPVLGNWVEGFPYQDGLLISYWDTSQSNNNTASHPGAGLILPIDAHPENMLRPDGGSWRGRIQSYDSTFGLEPTDAITVHWLSQPSYHPSLPAVPIFDDNNQYWNPETPALGVKNPQTGTQIRIKSISAQGGFMQVEVRPSNKGR